tara:strand:+ start:1483 stop:3681 length:2199 start_codon:yes stop_codon:yes gene_type:complete
MAKSPEEIQKQLERIAKLYQQLGEKNPFAGADATKIANATDEVKKLNDAFKGVESRVKDINSDLGGLVGAFKATLDEVTATSSGLRDSSKAFRELTSIASKLQQDQQGIVELTEKDLANLRQKYKLNRDLLTDSKDGVKAEIERLEAQEKLTAAEQKRLDLAKATLTTIEGQQKESDSIIQQLDEELSKREKLQEATNKNLGTFGKSVGGLGDVLDKVGGGKFGKMLGIEDAMKAGTKEAKSLAGKAGKGMSPMGKQLQVASKMIGTMGKALVKALGPVTIIAELVKGLMEADKQTNEIGRSMMKTQRESMKFSRDIQTATTNNYQFGITATKVLENVTAVSKQFGFITEFSGETLVSMTKLTYTLKIGAEEAGNLAAAAEASGINFEDNYKNILAASYELQQQAGTQVDLRQVLTETGKVTGQIRANMGGNTVEIAKAVTNARLLGSSFEDIANAGKQLLNFEDSITKELEAELLLGRDINLERARAAALTGDQVTLQNELAKEMGSFEEFTKMNVLQQEALAGALGMSADQIADMLFNQETMNKSVKELRDLGKDELANRLEQKTAQDKMNAAMAQLKQVFVDLGTALLPIINIIGIAAGLVSAIVGFVQDLIGGIGALFGMNDDFEFGKSAGYEGLKQAGKSTKQLFVGDAVIGPSGDVINTSPDDYLIATKNPQQMASNVSQAGPSVDTSKLERLLEASLNKKSPSPIIKMNDVKLGTAVDMGAFSIQ